MFKEINKLICIALLFLAIGCIQDNLILALALAAYPILVCTATFCDSVRRRGL